MSSRRTVWDDLADRIKALATDRATAASPPLARFKVISARPLVVEDMDGDVQLEEGDPDVEWSRYLLSDDGRPDVGDVVLVAQDADGDWVVQSVIDAGDDE